MFQYKNASEFYFCYFFINSPVSFHYRHSKTDIKVLFLVQLTLLDEPITAILAKTFIY